MHYIALSLMIILTACNTAEHAKKDWDAVKLELDKAEDREEHPTPAAGSQPKYIHWEQMHYE